MANARHSSLEASQQRLPSMPFHLVRMALFSRREVGWLELEDQDIGFSVDIRVSRLGSRSVLEANLHKSRKTLESVGLPATRKCISGLVRTKSAQVAAFEGVVLDPPLRCDAEPLNSDCHMNASLRSSSMSFSVQSRVGSAWRNIMTS